MFIILLFTFPAMYSTTGTGNRITQNHIVYSYFNVGLSLGEGMMKGTLANILTLPYAIWS